MLPTATPSSQGVAGRNIAAFLDALEARGHSPHSFALARHGKLVASGWWTPYSADRVHLVYSLSKSLTATAVALLVDRGLLGLDDPVLDHLAAAAPSGMDRAWTGVTLRHCLTMTLGHDHDSWEDAARLARGLRGPDALVTATLSLPLAAPPGTLFSYNQVATYLASAVVERATGRQVSQVLREHLLDALDIEPIRWHTDPFGRELGFTGAHLRTLDILKIAQLYADGGVRDGVALLPDWWVRSAPRPSGVANLEPGASAEWKLGYGCSFWTCRHGYRGDGAFGQFLLALPEQDAALAITSETADMQGVLECVWEFVVPALAGPGSAEEDARLAARTGTLAQPVPAGSAAVPQAALAGAMDFRRAPGSDLALPYCRVTCAAGADGWEVTLFRDRLPLVTRVGDGRWAQSRWRVTGEGPEIDIPVVAAGGWRDADTFVAEVLLIETPHRILIELDRRTGLADLRWRLFPLMGADPLALAVRPIGSVGPTVDKV